MIAILIAITLFFTSSRQSLAGSNNTLVCSQENDVCQLSSPSPLFNEQGVFPGYLQSQTLTVQNRRNEICSLKLLPNDYSESDLVAQNTTVSIVADNYVWFAGSLAQLLGNSVHPLGDIPSNASKDFLWSISFNQNADNSLQGHSSNFDLILNFSCGNPPTITPTPTPPPTEVTNPSEGISLNEVIPHPEDNTREWVEIYNSNNFTAILENWKMGRQSGGYRYFDDPIIIPPHTLVKVFLGNGVAFLNNISGYARLVNNNGIEVERTPEYRSPGSKSFSKQADGTWCLTTPSPGSANYLCNGEPPETSSATSQPTSSVSSSSSTSSPPSCTDAKPVGTPTISSITPSLNAVIITWSNPPSPMTYYLLAFGSSSGVYQYGNPNIGGSSVNSYTVNNLSGGTTYYFKLRSGNGCMPGDYSAEFTATPLGSQLSSPEPPRGFQAQVLGVTVTEPSQTEEPAEDNNIVAGLVKGDSVCRSAILPLAFLVALLLNSFLFVAVGSFRLPLTLAVTVLSYLLDRYISGSSCCLGVISVCNYYWIGSLISFLLPAVLFSSKKA